MKIDLPRNVIDSKTQGNKDGPYAVSESERSNTHCVEIKSTQLARTLAIDFVKGIGQISITGTNVFPIKEAPPKVALGNAQIVVNESSPVILNGSRSYDPDGDQITFAWTQTAGPNVMLKGGNTSMAAFTAPKVSNETKMSFNLRVKDKAGLSDNANETVIVRHNAPPPPSVSPISPNNFLGPYGVVFVYLGIMVAAMIVPLVYGMYKFYDTGKESEGLVRTLLAFGVILVVAILLFHIVTTITYNIQNTNPSVVMINNSLFDWIKSIGTIFGGAVSAIVGFYFGQRATESGYKPRATETRTPTVVTTPRDDGSARPNTPIEVTFSEPLDVKTVKDDSVTLTDDVHNQNFAGKASLSPDKKTIIFTHAGDLTPSHYIATVSDVKDQESNAVGSKTWKFTVKE